MTSLSYLTCSSIKCSVNKDGHEYHNKRIITSSIKINGNSSSSFHDVLKKDHDLMVKNNNGVAAIVAHDVELQVDVCEVGKTKDFEMIRQNIPTKKQMVDLYRQGQLITEGSSNGGYTQTVVVRSYEVGADKTATIETILNLFQETALNHVWMSGLLGDGFGATHGMMRNNLIWVVSRMKVQVDHYPIWGEVLEIETWVGSSGKNGMRRDWLIRSHATGHVYARATSTWVMMNQVSRRLSKMPDEVRAEVTPWFSEKLAIQEDIPDKIEKLGKNAAAAKYVKSGLQAKRSDLDMNQHVNNVKYVGWILETIPDSFLDSHQLSELILEYRRECGSSDVVQSLCEPDNGSNGILDDDDIEDGGLMITEEIKQNYNKISNHHLNGFSFSSSAGRNNNNSNIELLRSLIPGPFSYTHLLRIDGNPKNEEIVRGKTIWKKKFNALP